MLGVFVYVCVYDCVYSRIGFCIVENKQNRMMLTFPGGFIKEAGDEVISFCVCTHGIICSYMVYFFF